MFFLISTHFPCLSYSLIFPHLHPSIYSHYLTLTFLIWRPSVSPLISPCCHSSQLLNLSVFNQHPLNIKIQSQVLSSFCCPIILLPWIVYDRPYNINIKKNNISHQPPHLPPFCHPSFIFPPLSPHHLEPSLTPILHQHVMNSQIN